MIPVIATILLSNSEESSKQLSNVKLTDDLLYIVTQLVTWFMVRYNTLFEYPLQR